MAAKRLGGDESRLRYLLVYGVGVAVGTAVRLGAFVVPNRVVRRVEEALLPGSR